MLAKLWKKLLLAVCIVACIYNIMNKLVSRISLETQLNSVIEQTGIPNLINKEESSKTNTDNANMEEVEDSDNERIVVIY